MAIKRTSRLVVEVRREKNWFHFNDVKGLLVDASASLGFEKIKLTEGAFTVATPDERKKIFMSTANLGIQCEAFGDLDQTSELLDDLFKLINENKLFESLKSVSRVGTKLTTLYSPRTEDFNKVKRRFRDKLMKNYIDVEDELGVSLNDYAFESFNAKYENRDLSLLLGPVTIEEAIARFFQESFYLADFGVKTGYLADFDLSLSSKKISSVSQLRELLDKNIDYLRQLKGNFEDTFSNVS